jgi:magnesium transporter
MGKHRTKRSVKAGLPPGAMVHVGEAREQHVAMRLIGYDAERLLDREVDRVEDIAPLRGGTGTLWLDLVGLHNPILLEKLGQAFALHPLLMEDVLNTEQRPKFEDYDDYLFVVLKRLRYDRAAGQVTQEQVSLVLGNGFVLSFQEFHSNLFDPVRQRIHAARGRLRGLGPDALLHALMDSVVDEYFSLLEQLGEEIERLETQILDRPSPISMRTLHRLKRELMAVRRSVWPLREVIGGLERLESPLLKPGLDLYLRDVYDHTVHVIDTVESYRDMLAGMLDVYLSALSNRMNEIMKVLTIISTIFIPLTFLAGVYGMNFRYMPELEWHWGYFAVLGVMLAVAIGLMLFFRRKHWV